MISCELMGGFGNQLFQIASAIGLSCKHNTELYIPKWENKKYFPYYGEFAFLESNFKKLFEHNQKQFHYYERPYQDNTIYKGYYQSSKFFEGFDSLIKTNFEIDNKYTKPLSSGLYDKNTCSIHVRRGDYLTLEQFHPVQTIRYFDNAISKIKELADEAIKFYVFSDDIEWCKQNLKYENIEFKQGTMIEDFASMIACEHHIISNSSFSWWTSYLSGPGITIAPKNWFGPALSHETKDIYEKDWIII